MAEHVWFVPVSGGRGVGETVPVLPPQEFNVQWEFNPTATMPAPALASVESASVTQFTFPTPLSAQLRSCYGQWLWHSCAQGGVVVLGGQLAVGTVFSRKLQNYRLVPPPPPITPDLNPPTWNTVEAWVKYYVDSPARLDRIYFVINDSLGNWADPWAPSPPPPQPPPTDWLPVAALGGWRVAWTRRSSVDWIGWNSENLRATIHFPGTLNPANVGGVVIDIEWFAFRLSDQVSP
jgi:hypothetical protein